MIGLRSGQAVLLCLKAAAAGARRRSGSAPVPTLIRPSDGIRGIPDRRGSGPDRHQGQPVLPGRDDVRRRRQPRSRRPGAQGPQGRRGAGHQGAPSDGDDPTSGGNSRRWLIRALTTRCAGCRPITSTCSRFTGPTRTPTWRKSSRRGGPPSYAAWSSSAASSPRTRSSPGHRTRGAARLRALRHGHAGRESAGRGLAYRPDPQGPADRQSPGQLRLRAPERRTTHLAMAFTIAHPPVSPPRSSVRAS
jgi:hypothetical protein